MPYLDAKWSEINTGNVGVFVSSGKDSEDVRSGNLNQSFETLVKHGFSKRFTRWWFQLFLIFITYLRKWYNLTNIFSNGLKPPTSYGCFHAALFFCNFKAAFCNNTLGRSPLMSERLTELEPEGDLKLGQGGHSMRPIYSGQFIQTFPAE